MSAGVSLWTDYLLSSKGQSMQNLDCEEKGQHQNFTPAVWLGLGFTSAMQNIKYIKLPLQ